MKVIHDDHITIFRVFRKGQHEKSSLAISHCGASDRTIVAFEIEGFSMPPAEPGWLAVFRRTEAHPDDLINTPCLVDTADGRRLFKKLRKGYTPGRYNLESWDGSPLIEDVEIRAVLPFAALSPGRHAR